MSGLIQDLRFGLRVLSRAPTFAITVVLTIGFAVGANSSIFTLLDALVFRDLPVRNPSQVVAISRMDHEGSEKGILIRQAEEIAQQQHVFTGTAGWSAWSATVEANGRFSPRALDAVTGDFFSLLGVKPFIGRLIEGGDLPAREILPTTVAVISYKFWSERYASSPNILGTTVHVEGIPFTIIGVTPEDYLGLRVGISTDITVPLTAMPQIERAWNMSSGPTSVDYDLARLKLGVSIFQARADLEAMWPGIRAETIPADESPEQRTEDATDRITLQPAGKGFSPLQGQLVKYLYILFAIFGAVLLIACLNLACLLLARTAVRGSEMAVRIALGATPWRVARQILAETSLLTALGAISGLAFAHWGAIGLSNFITVIYSVPPDLRLTLDLRILTFTGLITILTSLAVGAVSAWRVASTDASAALQTSSRTFTGSANRIGRYLIVVQVALSLVLLVCAGHFVGSLEHLVSFERGFRTRGILEVELLPMPGGYKNLDELTYYSGLSERLASLPGVQSVSMSNMTPGTGGEQAVDVLQGSRNDGSEVRANLCMVTPGFFNTMGLSLLQGRDFTWQDNLVNSPVAIISDRLAHALFPLGDALGQQIGLGTVLKRQNVLVIGIVHDARISDIRSADAFSIFAPSAQGGKGSMNFPVVELFAAGDPRTLVSPVTRAVESLGHEYVSSSWNARDIIGLSLIRERVTAILSGLSGAVALLLVTIGLYAVLSYAVSQRTREIGIRMALGARRITVLWMILRDALRLALAGVVIGIPCAFVTSRLIASVLVEPSSYKLLTFLVSSLVLLTVALIAGYIPGRRATSVEPIDIIRYE